MHKDSLKFIFYLFVSEHSEKYIRPTSKMEVSKEELGDLFSVAKIARTCEIRYCMIAVYGEHCVSMTASWI